MTDPMLEIEPTDATEPQALLCPNPLIVRVHAAFSWQQSPSHWPYYLTRAIPHRAYSKKEIIGTIFQDSRTDRHVSNVVWLRSIYSFHIDSQYQEVAIEGIGLFERVNGTENKFHISSDGLKLAQAYSTNPASQEWKRVFANILARNDVRTRCILLHLGLWGFMLAFQDGFSDEAFFPSSKGSIIKSSNGDNLPLFAERKGETPYQSFTVLLQHDPYTTLGPFMRNRIEDVGLRVPNQIIFEGGRLAQGALSEPSTKDLFPYLRQTLSLFRDIGALVYLPHRQGWALDRQRCEEVLEPEVVADLFGSAQDSRFLEVLRASVGKFSDASGMVRVADLRAYVCDELDMPIGERVDYFNRQVAYYLRPEVSKLSIGQTFHAAAPPDDCLFGDLAQEYVEFIFAPE